MSKVYMVSTEDIFRGDSLIDRLDLLWNHEEIGLNNWIEQNEIVLIKTHFGSRNQTRHLRPMYIRKIVDSNLNQTRISTRNKLHSWNAMDYLWNTHWSNYPFYSIYFLYRISRR